MLLKVKGKFLGLVKIKNYVNTLLKIIILLLGGKISLLNIVEEIEATFKNV